MMTTLHVILWSCLSLGFSGDPQPPRVAVPGQGAPWLENLGQWRPEISFGTWVGPVWVGVAPEGVDLYFSDPEGLGTQRVRVEVPEARFECRGLNRAPGIFNDFHGDPSQWVRGVHCYGAVEMTDATSGLRLALAERGGRLHFEVLDHPTAGEGQLRMTLPYHAQASPTPGGALLVLADFGSIELEVFSFQNGVRRPSQANLLERGPVAWVPRDDGASRGSPTTAALGFSPELTWSTLWGSVPTVFCNVHDVAEDAYVDPQGRVTVAGTVAGIDYILTPGAFHTAERCDDIFVAKFDQATGCLVYSTRIGSTTNDEGKGVAVDATGRATVVGWVGQGAQGFPTTPGAFDTVKSQFDQAGVVFRLTPDGSQLEYSTFIEGDKGAGVYAVALSSTGSAVVTGIAGAGFPTTAGAYATQLNGTTDAFVTRLDPTGSFLEFSTLIGGSASEAPARVHLNAQESVILAGYSGLDYPTTPGALKSQAQGADAFVSCLDPTGSTLLWSTFVGGSSTDYCYDMALTPDGGAILVGMTQSADFPTTPGVLQENDPGDWNGWVTRVDPGGSTLRYSTFLGGTKKDWVYTVATDKSGLAVAGGELLGQAGFPLTPGAFQSTGSSGIFATWLTPDGSRALYTVVLGGAGSGSAEAMAIGPSSLVTMGGDWEASNGTGGPFPTTPGALVPTALGSKDAFITTLYPLLQGVKLAGTSSPSCLGPINANATTMPLAGQPFGLYCTQAPPDADGYLITFTGELMPSIQPLKAGPEGFLETDLGNLPNTPGKVRRYRYAFRNTPTCPGQGAFSFSNMVIVQVQ